MTFEQLLEFCKNHQMYDFSTNEELGFIISVPSEFSFDNTEDEH
mgnify:FL=1